VSKELAAATRAAARAATQSSTAELEEQLNKMCQDVLAKQALLEQIMSEKTVNQVLRGGGGGVGGGGGGGRRRRRRRGGLFAIKDARGGCKTNGRGLVCVF